MRINATDGDINIKGSNVFGKGGLQLQAANGEIHNLAAQEKSDVESSGFNRTSGLMGGGSIASRFIGSKTETTHEHNRSIQEVASTIGDGSPLGSVFEAQGYTQIGSNLLSGGHVDIYAKNIQIKAGEATQSNNRHYNFTQKGITVGVNAPITQAIDSAQSAVRSLEQAEQSGKQRTQAMAVANAGMQAYQASQAINKIGSGSKGGGKGGSNGVSISVTYGEQRNQSHSEIQDQQANASRILAEGQVRLHATGAGKDSNIKIEGSDVLGKQGTFLFADNQIDLLAAEQHHSEHHRNKNEGWNAGVAVSADKGASLGFTAGGNLGKGHADGEQTTYRHSHVGSAGSPTVIVSGGDTNIKGAQVTGKGITVRAANLNIESLQDTADYRSRQQNISAQVTVGYGASASGDYSQSKINAEHRSVSEQSGLFAGEDGFDVQVGGHTQLTGGIITSAQSAEAQGKNRFQSGSISQTDLHNISKYDGSSIGFGASVALSGETLGQGTQNNSKLTTVADKNSQGFNGVGYGRDSDHQESTTKSGIGTRNIILTDEAGQLAKTGYGTDKAIQLAYTDIRTEDAGQQSGSLKNRFDADKVQSELDLQREVSQQFSHNADIVRAEFNKDLDALNEKIKTEKDPEKQKEYEQQRDKLQQRQVFFNMFVAALSAPTDSAAGIAAATAAPAISYGIGQEFKNNKLKNEKDGGNRPTEGSATHIASHMALGAVVSALGGNDAVSGALAAGGAEALVPLFSKAMYGTTDPEKLTAADKQNLSNMARLFGAAVGAATGSGAANGYADVAQGSLNAGNAVENNENMITAFGIHPNGAATLNRAQTFYESQIRAGKSVDEANQALRDYLTSCKDCQEWRDSTFVKATNGFVNAAVDSGLELPREVADVISAGSNAVLKTDFPVNRSFIGKKAENGATILELTQDALFNAATVHPVVGAAVSSYNMGTAINEKDPEKFGRSVAGIAGSFITAKATGNPSYTVEFPGVQSSNLGMARWQRGSVSIPTVKKVNNQGVKTSSNSSKKLSSPNPIHNKDIRNAYEDIVSGQGKPNIDSVTKKQKIYQGRENSAWAGSTEWLVPNQAGRHHRILVAPNGRIGYVVDHDYSNIRPFPSPWYPDGGNLNKPVK